MQSWTHTIGPDGHQIRSQLCAEKSDLSPSDFICYQKAVYQSISSVRSDFGTWRHWLTFGLSDQFRNKIETHYEANKLKMALAKKVLRRCIEERRDK